MNASFSYASSLASPLPTHAASTVSSFFGATSSAAQSERKREELLSELDALHARYVAELPRKIARIEAMWHQLMQHQVKSSAPEESRRDFSEEVSLVEFYRLLHNLAGSGAMYGFAPLGKTARELTDILKPWSEPSASFDARPLGRELRVRIESLLSAMKAAL